MSFWALIHSSCSFSWSRLYFSWVEEETHGSTTQTPTTTVENRELTTGFSHTVSFLKTTHIEYHRISAGTPTQRSEATWRLSGPCSEPEVSLTLGEIRPSIQQGPGLGEYQASLTTSALCSDTFWSLNPEIDPRNIVLTGSLLHLSPAHGWTCYGGDAVQYCSTPLRKRVWLSRTPLSIIWSSVVCLRTGMKQLSRGLLYYHSSTTAEKTSLYFFTILCIY